MSNISRNGSDRNINRNETETGNDIIETNNTETEIPQNPVSIPNKAELNHSDNQIKSEKQVIFLNLENKLNKHFTTPSENDEKYQNSSIGIPEINFEINEIKLEHFKEHLNFDNPLKIQAEPKIPDRKTNNSVNYSLILNTSDKEKKENLTTSRTYKLETNEIEIEKKIDFENLTKEIQPKNPLEKTKSDNSYVRLNNEKKDNIEKEVFSKNSSESVNHLELTNQIIQFQDFKSDHSEINIRSEKPQKFNSETVIINETLLFNEKEENQIDLQDETINSISINTKKKESNEKILKEIPSESLNNETESEEKKTIKSESETIENENDKENQLIKMKNNEEIIENKPDYLSLNYQSTNEKFNELNKEKPSSERNLTIKNLSIKDVESQTGPIKTNNASQATWIQNKGIQANFFKNPKSIECCHRRCIQFGTVITILFFILGYLMRDFIDNLILSNC